MPKLRVAACMAALCVLAACGSQSAGCAFGFGNDNKTAAPTQPRIVLNVDAPRPTIDVIDVPVNVLTELGTLESREAWTTVFKVAVGPDHVATVGQYSIEGDRIRFTPMFPLDRGRPYEVTFTAPGGARPVVGTVALPPIDTTPNTLVSQFYPSADVIPANALRLYIHFSSAMSSRGGLDYIHLLDESGTNVEDPFLSLDAEFFNEDRTRYTVFLDPAKRLAEGKYYTLVVDAAWRDGKGLPLKEPFRHKFKTGPADDRPLDPKAWKIEAPAAATNAPLVIAFPEPIDHGLLERAIEVIGPNRKVVDGEMKVGPQETSWSFTPAEPWTAGRFSISVLTTLQDLAGNGIGRVFDAAAFDRSDDTPATERTTIPFSVK
jgi:hypothetical protein